jgi:ribosome-binding factor A
LAKVYLSIFPNDKALTLFEGLKENGYQLRHDLSQIMKNQLRRIPELSFYLDDSLDYIEKIEQEIKAGGNPIKNPSSLETRQKK